MIKISYTLIQNLQKRARPRDPFFEDADGAYRVDATARVPIELSFEGIIDQGLAGVDFVFLIDNSGSMRNTSDTGRLRFSAILELASAYRNTREVLDQVSIVVFSGDPDGSDTEIWMDWRTWSETEQFIAEYMAAGIHAPPDGTYTPMAKGMELANAQLAASTKPYKMVIMLSDGKPEPEYYEQQGQIQSVHIPFAREHEIIYSPILLGGGEDGASGLLDKIALETDYITDSLYFSFNAVNANEIKDKYDSAITGVSTRIVPKRIILEEKVNELLEVIDARLIIEENEFSRNQIAPTTPLAEAISQFETTGRFYIKFTELVGEATLKFDVKLKLRDVPLAALQQDYIEVNVNNTNNSSITFDHPMYGTLPQITGDDWPQTKLRFLTGVHVTKELIAPTVGSDYQVKISMVNMRATPLEWFWITESPSKYVDISEINDAFGFSPFSIIVEKFMIPHSFNWLLTVFEEDFDTSQKRERLRDKVTEYLRNFVLPFADQFDPYLCRYDIERAQRGIFKLVRNVPPLGERSLIFKVKGATFGTPRWRSDPVDNPLKKPPITSRYRYPGVAGWKYLEPNPEFGQIVLSGPKPEFEIDTCYHDYEFLALFFESLVGISPLTYENIPPPDPYEMLDSKDITLQGLHGTPGPLGLSIVIRNRGDTRGSTRLTVKSLFIPFANPKEPIDRWFKPFLCQVEDFSISINGRQDVHHPTESTFNIIYTNMILSDGTNVPVNEHQDMFNNFAGWIITTVDIHPVTNELLLGNNNAIGIKLFLPPRRARPSLWQRFIEGIRTLFNR